MLKWLRSWIRNGFAQCANTMHGLAARLDTRNKASPSVTSNRFCLHWQIPKSKYLSGDWAALVLQYCKTSASSNLDAGWQLGMKVAIHPKWQTSQDRPVQRLESRTPY